MCQTIQGQRETKVICTEKRMQTSNTTSWSRLFKYFLLPRDLILARRLYYTYSFFPQTFSTTRIAARLYAIRNDCQFFSIIREEELHATRRFFEIFPNFVLT